MRSDDRRSAEWRPVGGSSSRPRHHGRAQLRREGETGIGLWRGGGTCRLKGRRQETYDVIEISLIIDAGKPGLIGGARMRECDRSNDQKGQQHSAQATGTRGVQAIENGHSRLVRSRSVLVGRRHYGVGKVGCQDESYRLMIWICLMVRTMHRPLQLLLRRTPCSLVQLLYQPPRHVLTVPRLLTMASNSVGATLEAFQEDKLPAQKEISW